VVRDFDKGGEALKYRVVDELRHRYSVKEICKVLGVSRSGYYRYISRKTKPHKDTGLEEKIRDIYRLRNRTYGYRRIQAELGRLFGIRVNHKRVLRIMQKLGLRAVIRRKRRFQNPYRTPMGVRIAENLLNRNFHADAPNQKWVTDITWIPVGGQTLFLSVILDLFNNEVVAYHMSSKNDNELVLQTVQKAVEKRGDVTGTILHSDRGFQYTSHDYHRMLVRFGIRPSMSRKGDCLDNASIESFFSHFKTEALKLHDIQDPRKAQRVIEQYIHYYNEERIQLKINKLTPFDFWRKYVA
jgi:putative transposase